MILEEKNWWVLVKSVHGGEAVPKCGNNAFKPARILLEAKSIIIALRCQLFRSVHCALRLVKDVKPCLLTIPNNLKECRRIQQAGT
jgi:hypothetical protein